MVDSKKSDTFESEERKGSDDEVIDEPITIANGHKRKGSSDSSLKPIKKKSKSKSDLYKQPTTEELHQLRETENLFHSNLFRLQIEEVLAAVKLKPKYRKLLEDWFEKFKAHLSSIESNDDIELNNETLFEDCDVKIPMKKLPNTYTDTFKYIVPSNVMIGGSYSLDTLIGPDVTVDVFVEMPQKLFKRTDWKNYIYLRKKAVYLAFVGNKLNEELVQSVCYIGNHSNPILKIVPSGKLSKRCIIYIHLVVQDTTFPLNKLTPDRNNVKYNWFYKQENNENNVNSPTPHYNSIITYDLTTLKANIQNVKLIKDYPNIRDGIILLKVWLKQQEYSNNFETFNGHIITMYVLYLLLIKKLNTFMSSYQIVRNTWQYLGQENWCEAGISLCQAQKSDEKMSEYHKHYDCVFLDSSGFHNLAATLFADTFKWICSQAQMSLELLNITRINSFQVLFMRKVSFYKTFDQVVCLHHVKGWENVYESMSGRESELNFGSNKYVPAVKLIMKVLKRGLGNRVSAISIYPRKLKEWALNEDVPNDLERLYIGLQLNPSYCFDIVEKGPDANLEEAFAFRNFWEHKSELRRFKDGRVCEAIVWCNENATFAEKREIPQSITKYLFEQKLKLFERVHFFQFSNQIEEFLRLEKVTIKKLQYSNEEMSLLAISAFDSLVKDLKNLSDLPLEISGVQGSSASLRYTDVFPPVARYSRADEINVIVTRNHLRFADKTELKEVPLHQEPVQAVIQMSSSGKWPDDVQALRMTKAAFYLQIAESLRKQCKLNAQASMDHVDVMKDGLPFRLRIAVQKEIGLVKQQTSEDGVIKYRDTDESLELEEKLVQLPKITGALAGLHRQHPSFGPACCLAKRWLSSQLIDESHMPGIVVELLMASMFLESKPYRAVQLPQVGFLRFLEAFAREQWSTDPVLVNFNGEMTHKEIVEAENFYGEAEEGKLPALFIITPYDRQSSTWTRKSPSLLILARISDLAKEVLRILEAQLFNCPTVHWRPIFQTPLSEYDCLIKLSESFNPRRHYGLELQDNETRQPVVELQPVTKNYVLKIPILGFDPVAEYLRELRSIYNDFALFFHDTYGGSVIGVLIKPQAYQERDFKVAHIHCQKLNDNGKLILNVAAMIEDFYILGKGLVETIDIQSENMNTI